MHEKTLPPMQNAATDDDVNVTSAHQLKQSSTMRLTAILFLSSLCIDTFTSFSNCGNSSSSIPHDAIGLANIHSLPKHPAQGQHAQFHGPASPQPDFYGSQPLQQLCSCTSSPDQQEQLRVSSSAGCRSCLLLHCMAA